jgi:hypothetical protein
MALPFWELPAFEVEVTTLAAISVSRLSFSTETLIVIALAYVWQELRSAWKK